MFLRVLLLMLISIGYLHAADSDVDPDLEEAVDASRCCKGFSEEYCCMVFRVTSKCTIKGCDALGLCCTDSINCIADNTLPCRHKNKKERTKCVKKCLSKTCTCLAITGGIGSCLSGIVTAFCYLVTDLQGSWAAETGLCVCKTCVACGACSVCFKDDSVCPLPYCCEKFFNLEKLSSFSGNEHERNLEEITSEIKNR